MYMLPVFIVWIAFDMHTDGYHSYMCAKKHLQFILFSHPETFIYTVTLFYCGHFEGAFRVFITVQSLHSLHVNILVTAFYAWFVCISLPDLHIQMCTCNYAAAQYATPWVRVCSR